IDGHDGAPATQLDLGRMSHITIDEDVYAGAAPGVTADATAETEQIQKALLEGDQPIDLAATAQETEKRIATAFTDPARKLKSDPGHPDICNIYSLHKIFTKELMKDKFEPIVTDCREAKVGCVQCKKLLASSVNLYLTPFREKRQELALKPGYIEDVLANGAIRARKLAQVTLIEVKKKMGLI
ncbi:MAG: hypothetical protein NTV30_02070, partial [Chloroflexi bacterium]|nr:hypothetical protein [Chloroflexota bacterium]